MVLTPAPQISKFGSYRPKELILLVPRFFHGGSFPSVITEDLCKSSLPFMGNSYGREMSSWLSRFTKFCSTSQGPDSVIEPRHLSTAPPASQPPRMHAGPRGPAPDFMRTSRVVLMWHFCQVHIQGVVSCLLPDLLGEHRSRNPGSDRLSFYHRELTDAPISLYDFFPTRGPCSSALYKFSSEVCFRGSDYHRPAINVLSGLAVLSPPPPTGGGTLVSSQGAAGPSSVLLLQMWEPRFSRQPWLLVRRTVPKPCLGTRRAQRPSRLFDRAPAPRLPPPTPARARGTHHSPPHSLTLLLLHHWPGYPAHSPPAGRLCTTVMPRRAPGPLSASC